MPKQQLQATRGVRRVTMHESDRNSERRARDWAKLPPDLAAEIASRLLRFDVAEYIRFRAVCKPWRQSTDEPRGQLHGRFFPRNWVMLSNYGEYACRRLLNIVTGASIRVDLHELSGHNPVGYTEGLLVLLNKTSSAIRLLNPLTRAVTDLPDFSSIFVHASRAMPESVYEFRGFGVIDGATVTSPPTVVLCLDGAVSMIACVKPGDPRWALVSTSEFAGGAAANVSFHSALSLRGRFYVLTSTGDVLTVQLDPEPRAVFVVKQEGATSTLPAECSFLAPSSDHHAGMLMVRTRYGPFGCAVEVFVVDVAGRRLIPTRTVGADRAVFLGSCRTLSISARLFPSIAANALYFSMAASPWSSSTSLFDVFYLDNGWGKPAKELDLFDRQGAERVLRPFNLDDCLACCVDAVYELKFFPSDQTLNSEPE